MAFTNYSTLAAAVRDWLGRANDTVYLTDDRVADAVRLAEIDIYERLRVREMEAFATITADLQVEQLPTGFIGMRRAYLVSDPIVELEYMTPPQFWGTFSSVITGQPRAYTIEGENIAFGPAPDATYSVNTLYWKRLDGLYGLVGTNNLFVRQPDLWLYGALSHACVFTQDNERLATFRAAFAEALDRAERSNERDRYGSSPLVMRPG